MKLATLAERWSHRCGYCGTPLDHTRTESAWPQPTLDHFIPRRRGGRRGLLNSVYACAPCNQEKGAVDPRRLLWVWLRLDPQGLLVALLSALESPEPNPANIRLVVDNSPPEDTQ